MSALLKAFFSALLDGIRAFFDQKARDASMREAGQAEQAAVDAKTETEAVKEIGAIADDQAANNAIRRGGAGDVLTRLRERTKAGGSGP